MYISFVASPLMKYAFFASLDENKWHIHSKNLNILYVFYLEFIYKDKLDIHKTCFFNENASPTKCVILEK